MYTSLDEKLPDVDNSLLLSFSALELEGPDVDIDAFAETFENLKKELPESVTDSQLLIISLEGEDVDLPVDVDDSLLLSTSELWKIVFAWFFEPSDEIFKSLSETLPDVDDSLLLSFS